MSEIKSVINSKPQPDSTEIDKIPSHSKTKEKLALELFLTEKLAEILMLPPEKIEPAISILNFGLDSLMALELQDIITKKTGVEINSQDLLAGHTIQELVNIIYDKLPEKGVKNLAPEISAAQNAFFLTGNNLSLKKIIQIAYHRVTSVEIDDAAKALMRISCEHLSQTLRKNEIIYGVNTNFGGMANGAIIEDQNGLQHNLLWGLKCGAGATLPVSQVRAGMLIRANSLVKGYSAIRPEIVERLCRFLNAGLTPLVYEYGSIGASGDLVPLSYIAGAIIGLDDSYQVFYKDKIISASEALKILQLTPVDLSAKEGLALVNGTSMMTGIASDCIYKAENLFNLSLTVHAFLVQALMGDVQCFDAFIHEAKPHQGQLVVAEKMRALLAGNKFSSAGQADGARNLFQDRYSIRCLPQYLAVTYDALQTIKLQIETEANSLTDNPLVDTKSKRILHGGNFMGQYIGAGMDQLRYHLAMLVKHLDVQIALLVSPEFNNGLPASLAGNEEDAIRFGLKGLQLCGNSILPLMMYQGNNLTLLYPTHAEQFNQNINSQGYNAAYMTSQSIKMMEHYLSISLVFAVQSIELRAKQLYGSTDARPYLSDVLAQLYELLYSLLDRKIQPDKPLIYQNANHSLDRYLHTITQDLTNIDGKINSLISSVYA